MTDLDDVLERVLSEPAFARSLAQNPTAALAGYDLSDEDMSILSTQVSFDRGMASAVEERTTKAGLVGLVSSMAEGFAGLGGLTDGDAHGFVIDGCEPDPGGTVGIIDDDKTPADTVGIIDDNKTPGDTVGIIDDNKTPGDTVGIIDDNKTPGGDGSSQLGGDPGLLPSAGLLDDPSQSSVLDNSSQASILDNSAFGVLDNSSQASVLDNSALGSVLDNSA